MKSPKRLARIAGLLYLLVGIFGGFAEGFVYPKLYVAGNAAATAANVTANPGLARLGVVSDLLDQTFFVLLALTLYVLLKQVNKNVARAMVVFVLLAVAITCLNAVFEFEGLRVATGAVDTSSLGTSGTNALILVLLDVQHYGIFVAQIFFGLWLAPLGYLAYKSGWFPKPLGITLMVAAGVYLVDLFVAFLLPGLSTEIHGFLGIVPAIAEISMVLFLVIFGVRIPKPAKQDERALALA
ncbi:DUF4386 domain-containing protein [Diaminobutyricibacter sp. McL0618]|uniref:DUF4386 domain-containing protein n=1 Tax=Leifsonia sp. McL0618 TaxID=3415677 RepID=UPI003CE7EB05